MNKGLKLFIGFLTVLPIGYMIFFFINFMSFPEKLIPFEMLFKLHVIAIIGIMGLIAFYMVHIVKTNGIADNQRVIWIIAILVGSIFGMLAYWYLYIWSAPTENTNIE